ncbi:MAG: hypothetical protein OHK0048_24020 [Rhodoferax sp.]
MSALTALNHVANALAPALWLALLLPLVSRFFAKKNQPTLSYFGQAAIFFIALSTVIVLGFMCFDHDGKLLTYATLVLVGGSVQWLMLKSWRG